MTKPSQEERRIQVVSSAISDRGLNERRPLNEDSFLADSQRGVFAVADGVGGAEAGEVASQTAVEVLDEAFRHQLDGADIEDLMELAIQRANASIFQMAQEHAKFSMMATTIVALHLNGNTATFGHVGDSRLYRLTPQGQLIRETEDHSVVEEEVRAGRMTPEQAANHPSKNVISRALGAEHDVEVDMRTIEVEAGTQFLLCTDGITRHVPDYEIRQLLIVHQDLGRVCDELKKRCFERGAEDNLTAVAVRLGDPIPSEARSEELERTVSPDSPVPTTTAEATAPNVISSDLLVRASRAAFPAGEGEAQASVPQPLNIGQPEQPSRSSFFGRVMVFILILIAVGGAFYAGRKYQGFIPYIDQPRSVPAQPAPTPVVAEDPLAQFVRARAEVDAGPAAWLSATAASEMARQGIQQPLDSQEPVFLYLYGRASMLVGDTEMAARSFEAAIQRANAAQTPASEVVRKEAVIALAAVALRVDKERPQALTHLEQLMPTPTPAINVSP